MTNHLNMLNKSSGKRTRLSQDLQIFMSRRHALSLLAGGVTLPVLASCGSTDVIDTTGTCVILPEETNGPYPADGSNNANGSLANVLLTSGLIREDMRDSFGGLTGTADGVPMNMELTVVDAAGGCAPLVGYVVYAWHCTADGLYSIYNTEDQNYLRAAGVTDANGKVKFTTIFPGCYMGRMPHIHFEVYPSVTAASEYSERVLCSQIAFEDETADSVYQNVPLYADSIRAFSQISRETDNVFRDNTDAEFAAQTMALNGNYSAGFDGTLTIALDPSTEPVLNDMMGPGGPRGAGGPPPGDGRMPPPDGFPPRGE